VISASIRNCRSSISMTVPAIADFVLRHQGLSEKSRGRRDDR